MKRKTIWLAAILLGLLALGEIWFARYEKPSVAVEVVDRPASTSSASKPPDEPGALEEPREISRAERHADPTPSTATDAFASLSVAATWSDATPAQGVSVRVIREWREDPSALEHRAVLDLEGSARFDKLPPGDYVVQLDRCGDTQVRLEAGRESVAAIVIPEGVRVDGRVVDGARASVAGATIFLSSRSEGYRAIAVAISDGDGRFELRDIASHRVLIARANGLTPSPPFDLEAEAGERVECTLVLDGEGGSLDVDIHDEKNAPLPGIEILVRDTGERATVGTDGKSPRSDPGQLSRSDPAGKCRFFGLAAGSVLVEARSRDHAPWKGHAAIEKGLTTTMSITLGAPGSIQGVVTDSESIPLSGVTVAAGFLASFSLVCDLTDEDGSYRLDGLAPGVIDLWVSGYEVGRNKLRIDVIAGQVVTWNFVLADARYLAGIVLAEDGKPLAGWRVNSCRAGRVEEHAADAVTDVDGRFRLDAIPQEAEWLVLREGGRSIGKPSLVLRDVPIPSTEFVIRVPRASLPTAFVRGRVLGPQSQPLGKSRVSLREYGSGSGFVHSVNVRTGDFRLGPLMPGRYALSWRGGELDWQDRELELAADQELDLGILELAPGGFVSVELRSPEGSIPSATIPVQLVQAGGSLGDAFPCAGGAGKSRVLPPGEYSLRASTTWYFKPQTVRVESSKEARVTVTVEPGACRVFRLSLAPDAGLPSLLRCELRDAGGAILRSWECPRDPLSASSGNGLLGGLALGEYRLDVSSETGARGSASFGFTRPGLDPTPLIVDVR